MGTKERVAVIGGGLAGLVCARDLQASGALVTVFDKARGPGGRLTTRRAGEARFDHGAQYFTACSPAFEAAVIEWEAAGVVAPWTGRFGQWSDGRLTTVTPPKPRWVGTPRMSMIGRHLSVGLDVRLRHRVTSLESGSHGWQVILDGGDALGDFRRVIVTCPGPQAAAILPPASSLRHAALEMTYAPCWAAMLSFAEAVEMPYDGIHFKDDVLGWVARDSSKPGRGQGERWVLHGAPAWSQIHIDDEPAHVQQMLVARFVDLTGAAPETVSVHRWLYAQAGETGGAAAIFDAEHQLGLCGDALAHPRVEGAFLSGRALSGLILGAEFPARP
jgi:predicted NAD/FAD-dependent oxidoreductase